MERMEDLQNLAAACHVMASEREEINQKQLQQKEVCKRAWLQQIKNKKQEKLLNDELLTG